MKNNTRNSGVELLKIVAIFLIVISHIVGTISSENPFVSCQGYVLDLTRSTRDLQTFFLSVFQTFGVFGNAIFFICSAYYLLDNDKVSKKKIYHIIVEVWIVSIIILALALGWVGTIDVRDVIRSIFPTTFSNNWYLTCYILFYAIHGYLNKIIYSMDQRQLFRCASILICIYIGINYVKPGLLQYSELAIWISIYFGMAYFKKYLSRYMDSIKINVLLLIIGVLGHVGIMGLTNVLGLYIGFLDGYLLHWETNCNPFVILMALALFNLFRKLKFSNKTINYVSGLSLLIYIIHENLILRTYVRPYIVNDIYIKYGYSNVLLWVLVLAVLIFLFSLLASVLYQTLIKKIVIYISDKIYAGCRKLYLSLENRWIG